MSSVNAPGYLKVGRRIQKPVEPLSWRGKVAICALVGLFGLVGLALFVAAMHSIFHLG